MWFVFLQEIDSMIIWGAVCAKIKLHVAFIFQVGIYGIHDGNLLKSLSANSDL